MFGLKMNKYLAIQSYYHTIWGILKKYKHNLTHYLDNTVLFQPGEADDRDQSKLEVKMWDPECPLTNKQIDQFLVVARYAFWHNMKINLFASRSNDSNCWLYCMPNKGSYNVFI